MSRRDGTGPMGYGPMTGRGLGRCTGVNTSNIGSGLALRFGRRLGLGRRFGRGFGWNQTPVQSEKDLLAEEKEILKSRLDAIDKQLGNL